MHIFLSPHFDDAVFSCGGTIHQLVTAGENAHIITVMAGEPLRRDLDTPILRDLHERWDAGQNPVRVRREEDNAAVRALGTMVTHLEIPDCVYRTADGMALYPTEEALWGYVHPDDDAVNHLRSLTDMISGKGNTYQSGRKTTIYAPLAVGDHVDHLIVRDWAQAVAKSNAHIRLRFYTDYPYMRDVKKIDAALQGIAQPLLAEDVTLKAADVQARIEAMACYESQISTFWQDRAAMASDVRNSLLKNDDGQPVERFWSFLVGD
jgi:LmbE family N-acetylglucosaminyl deacetylase